jgi:FHA domain
VPDPVLTLLKYVFLAILYLFFLRVLRAVWVELREPKSRQPEPGEVPDRYHTDAAPGVWPVTPSPLGHPYAPGPHPEDPTVGEVAGSDQHATQLDYVPYNEPSPESQPPGTLVAMEPDSLRGREFPLDEEVTVGRAGGCAVLLATDTFVSQLHARVFLRDGQLYVEDLGSTNGTFLNGTKVSSTAAIHAGDLLQFGETTLELRR